MNKNIKRLVLLFIILMVITITIVLVFGRKYTLSFDVGNHQEYELIIDNEDGEVKVIDENKVNDKYFVKIESVKPGRSFLRLDYGDYQEAKVVYIHKSMIITDNNYFGKSTCSEVIPISLTIILVYSLYILINRYRQHKKDNLYHFPITLLTFHVLIHLFQIDVLFFHCDLQYNN